ncbi:hypothetical protein [Olsenella porci]|uniref:Uncharacterized protein n=1 Tax=Olsenella porci TaxID=2652279 RepID=A0A6N7XPS7_9ACTN|nr:hypothetical protein [Olsenella porci]MST73268.1 hypothetical protein [Olsenella porci]
MLGQTEHKGGKHLGPSRVSPELDEYRSEMRFDIKCDIGSCLVGVAVVVLCLLKGLPRSLAIGVATFAVIQLAKVFYGMWKMRSDNLVRESMTESKDERLVQIKHESQAMAYSWMQIAGCIGGLAGFVRENDAVFNSLFVVVLVGCVAEFVSRQILTRRR